MGTQTSLAGAHFWYVSTGMHTSESYLSCQVSAGSRYLPQFVAAQLGSNYGKAYFLSRAKKTTGIATINQQVLKAFPLFVPPYDVQKDVMVHLSERAKESRRIVGSLDKQLEEIEKLPAKLLSQAFEIHS